MSLLEVNKITPQSGTTLTLGDSGDTINFGSGVLPNFENLTVTGDLTVDTNSLYVDSTNNRVGIGTASPATALEISNNSPRIRLTDANYSTGSQVEIQGDNGNIFINADQTGLNSNRLIAFQLNNSEAMRITSSGNVGIGTSSPTSFLANSTTLEISDSDNYGSEIILTNNSPMTDNEIVGSLIFKNTDSSGTPNHFAGIRARAEDTFGRMDIEFYAGRSRMEDGTPDMVIAPVGSDGQAAIGIGTSSPVGKLDVRGEQDFVNQDGVNDSGAINAVSDIDTNNGSDAVASLAFKAPYSTGNSDRVVYGAITGHKNNSVQGQRHGNLRFYTNSSSAVTERMRIDSSGNVLVGKTTTNTTDLGNTVYAGIVSASMSGDPAIFANRSQDGSIIELQKNGTKVGEIGTVSGTDCYIGSSSTADTGLRFQTDEIVPVGNAGGNRSDVIDLGKANIRWKDFWLSGSIYIGGTTPVNALDDYEEGTWTATFTGSTTTATGRYTKVGNKVFVSVYGTGLNVTSSVSARIGGLPFTPNGNYSVGAITHNTYATNAENGYIDNNTTDFYIIQNNNTNPASTVVGNPKYIMMAGFYETNA